MNRIFLSPPHMSGKEQAYIAEVFESNYIAPVGTFVNRFEESVETYTGASNALALSSATAGLHLALRVLGVGEGDYVLASTFTFIGSVSAILYQNAKPIFVDSDESWNISPELLYKAIKTAPKKPKVLILTHLYGQVCKLDEIVAICKENGIYLIEDAAESLGASYHGSQSGTFGDMAVYSFNGNKILTTSGGGMLVSENEGWIAKAKFLSTQAKEDYPYYEHKEFGYNYRMSNVLAAIGVAQMEVLSKRVERRREIFQLYQKNLCKVAEIEFMPEIRDSCGNRWLTTLILKKSNPLKVIEALEKVNIESRSLWKPMHLQPLFLDALVTQDGTSQKLFEKGLCLPSGSSMSDEQVSYVCEEIIRVLN
ncbi:MAG: aminotransferase class I/II-fold pyridoxal phosphate-dependent enzyme [Campylobacterota bacterium]|nr:aminotransferase class I/II-fold pyridoxal phosphate-dependent enzyme [Campylobacterota bacterium]